MRKCGRDVRPRGDAGIGRRRSPRPAAPAAVTARISRGATAELIAGLARVDGGQGEQRDVRRRSPSVPGRTTRPASFPATSRQRLNTLYAPLRKLRYIRRRGWRDGPFAHPDSERRCAVGLDDRLARKAAAVWQSYADG